MAEFDEFLDSQLSDDMSKEVEKANEKDFYAEIKKRNKDFLIDGLTVLERERIAEYIINRYEEAKPKHEELCDRLKEHDDTFRMVRKSQPDDDGELPNYVSPISTVTCEVVHANIMNVLFSPKDIMRVLPTEQNDIPKIKKLGVFGNWSMINEMGIFEACDRLFHFSSKSGECPYIVHWVKEYGVEIKREMIMNPADNRYPLIDQVTEEPLYQEVEESKLLYNGPRLEILSRKDYIQPPNAVMDVLPEYEMVLVRWSYDRYLREQLAGKVYPKSKDEIMGWDDDDNASAAMDAEDFEGDDIPIGRWNEEFIDFYGRLRVNIIKKGNENDVDEYEELEGEFIGKVHIESQTLCALRKNKFPLKMRPTGIDYFMPDDTGRRAGIGIMEMMKSLQACYDALFNQYVFGTTQSNNPFGFFSPLGNQRQEKIKIRNGYLYPTSDPNSVNIVKLPPPDSSLQIMLDIVRFWTQTLFGISDYAAGVESQIDPGAPAKKAEIVVGQGSVRLNMIIKRKNATLKDIFKRWFLLYKENMPPNKFMRIAGNGEDPFKFESMELSDFALNSLPDFELTGNILNVNKSLEAQKKLATYQVLIANPFFSPQTQQGLIALNALTKWFIDGIEDTGLSRILPSSPGENVLTPEEENARFLQGDEGMPTQEEDHITHIKVHGEFLLNPTLPDDIRKMLTNHIHEHIKIMQSLMTQQAVLGAQGGLNGAVPTAAGAPAGILPQR